MKKIYPRIPVDLPADVDLPERVRGVRPEYRPPQVLLNVSAVKAVHIGRGQKYSKGSREA